jgi:hypothetical protein
LKNPPPIIIKVHQPLLTVCLITAFFVWLVVFSIIMSGGFLLENINVGEALDKGARYAKAGSERQEY